MGWIVAAKVDGKEVIMIRPGKRTLPGVKGEATWCTKKDAAGGPNDGWWKEYAWVLPKEEAQEVLDWLDEQVLLGKVDVFNRPSKAWIEEI
jgi:hypothetical protein